MKNGRLMLLTAAVVMLASSYCFGYITVDWRSTGYVLTSDGLAYVADGSLVQLIWSATDPTGNAAVDPVINSDSLAAGEFLLDSGAINAGDPDYTSFYFGQTSYYSGLVGGTDGDDTINSGYIFSRIFSESSVTAGSTMYYQSAYATDSPNLPNPGSPADPTKKITFDVTLGGEARTTGLVAVVPEPATFALFGLGALVVGLRRRKQS